MMTVSPVEEAKRLAAYAAVDKYVKDGMVIGVGSGSTVVYAVDRIAELVKNKGLQLRCIPSSFQAKNLIRDNGLVMESLDNVDMIDVTIDGADEVDPHLNLIKGGGACHVQEKLLCYNSKKFIVVADYRKISHDKLGVMWDKGVPVEVIPMALEPVMRKLTSMGGKPILRLGKAKAGPVVSDNGNLIIDVIFGPISHPAALHSKLLHIPGVIDTGLFIGMAEEAFFGMEDGSVTTISNEKNTPQGSPTC